ncbi:hypothetical protein MMC31_001008 [Peltigera leucophlebia]|nr:hypothetical protein [Peltigera leucophlebia]
MTFHQETSSPSLTPTKICVFASTVAGHSPIHLASARSLAGLLHARGIHLVYGGGTTGLMGALAKERVRLGGKETVVGVIPTALLGTERGASNPSQPVRKGETEAENSWVDKVRLKLGLKNKDQKAAAGKSPKITAVASASLVSEDIYGLTIPTDSLSARKELMISLVANAGAGSGFLALSGGFGSLDEIMEVVTFRQMGLHQKNMVLYNVDGYWDGLVAWMENAIEKGFLREQAREMLLVRGNAEDCVDALQVGSVSEPLATGKNQEDH